MNAESIVEKFGGQSALASALGKTQSTVQYWVKSGAIPNKWHRTLLEMAQQKGIDLLPEHFIPEMGAYQDGVNSALDSDSSITTVQKKPASKDLPSAKYRGFLSLGGLEVPCYVLENGQRVIGRTSLTEFLTGIQGGGGLERYLEVVALKPFLDMQTIVSRMVSFSLPEVESLGRSVKGLPADLVIEICKGFMSALEAHSQGTAEVKLTPRQVEVAIRAGMFVAACAKTGLDALIDEATGAQYDRAEDALRVKLAAYLSDEMREWEKTFPDELWVEFGRLTNWKGTITQRPKYWGKLVNELVYDYIDPEVAKWLREHKPKPRHGQNYHQWLTSQYGLKKLVEHIWMLIGMASACSNMPELKTKMAEKFGRQPIQYTLFLPPPTKEMRP